MEKTEAETMNRRDICYYVRMYVEACDALNKLGVEVTGWDDFGMVEIKDVKSGKKKWWSGIWAEST